MSVTPAVALAQIVKPASVIDPDVTVMTLPMTAAVQMMGLATIIRPEPILVRAEMSEPVTRTTGQDAILFLREAQIVTLYLKEDA